MRHHLPSTTAAILIAGVVLASCSGAGRQSAPVAVQPGAPGEPSRPVPVGEIPRQSQTPVTGADIQFIRGMIPHHRQALEMTALVESRTESRDIRLLAERIKVSQRDEIEMMERWMARHGVTLPRADAHAHHGAGHAQMPGMLSSEEMARLAAARGAEFDRLFLELMIRHHQGALHMVEELFASAGGGQSGEIFQLANEVAADQSIEIDRMRRMLAR